METIELTDDEKAYLREAVVGIKYEQETVEEILSLLYRTFAGISDRLQRSLFDFVRRPDSGGAILLRNLPTDDELPPTPSDGRPSLAKVSFVSELCGLGLAQILGEPVGYRDEKQGDLIHNICPVRRGTHTQSNESSRPFLRFHNDVVFDARSPQTPFNVNNPDFFLLTCLRDDQNGEAQTIYSDARDICARLTASEVDTLRQPIFCMAAPYSFRDGGMDVTWSAPLPVISGPPRFPEIALDFGSGMRSLDQAATGDLLDKIEAICSDPDVATSGALTPGDVLVVNNRKGVHARSGFTPSFDGFDRWLQRIYVRTSIWSLRDGTGFSRIF